VVAVGVVQGEERFDGNTRPHPHGICTSCGRVIDLPFQGGDDRETQLGEVGDFVIDYRATVFYGLCGECRRKAASWGQPPVVY